MAQRIACKWRDAQQGQIAAPKKSKRHVRASQHQSPPFFHKQIKHIEVATLPFQKISPKLPVHCRNSFEKAVQARTSSILLCGTTLCFMMPFCYHSSDGAVVVRNHLLTPSQFGWTLDWYRITQCSGLEGTSVGHPVQPSC